MLNKNNKIFNNLVKIALRQKDDLSKIEKLKKAANFASSKSAGIFNSLAIEECLIEISQKNNIDIDYSFKKNSTLHILTQAYKVGGHTRVCERWIKYSPRNESHSVIFTDQDKMHKPLKLQSYTSSKNGELIFLDGDYIKKALQLRKIASKFERIILHIHMDDVIPILAFGNNTFKRPINLFNHGDHLFWLGVSISDCVINFRNFAITINEQCRNIKSNFLLPLPIDKIELPINKNKAIKTRRKLNLDQDCTLIVTMASKNKYKPFDNYNFFKTISLILDSNPSCSILAIGPSSKNHNWSNLIKKYNNRVCVTGSVDNDKIEEYLEIADIGIDSFPFSSFTSLLDIAKYNIPCFSLKTPINELDIFNKSKIYCDTQEELIRKVTNQIKINKSSQTLYRNLEENHFPDAFSKNIEKLYKNLPNTHEIKNFATDIFEERKFWDFKLFVYKMQFINLSKTKRLLNFLKGWI